MDGVDAYLFITQCSTHGSTNAQRTYLERARHEQQNINKLLRHPLGIVSEHEASAKMDGVDVSFSINGEQEQSSSSTTHTAAASFCEHPHTHRCAHGKGLQDSRMREWRKRRRAPSSLHPVPLNHRDLRSPVTLGKGL